MVEDTPNAECESVQFLLTGRKDIDYCRDFGAPQSNAEWQENLIVSFSEIGQSERKFSTLLSSVEQK